MCWQFFSLSLLQEVAFFSKYMFEGLSPWLWVNYEVTGSHWPYFCPLIFLPSRSFFQRPCQFFPPMSFLDALASLDFKLSVGDWYFLQLAHRRVFQIFFTDRVIFCGNVIFCRHVVAVLQMIFSPFAWKLPNLSALRGKFCAKCFPR